MTMTRTFSPLFTNPKIILIFLGAYAAFALTFALISQYGFGLHPCELCIYQRIPFVVVIFLSVMGLMAIKRFNVKYGAFNVFLIGIALLVNSGIAFYHIGVEEGWWTSGCSLGNLSTLNIDDLAASIKSAPAVSCSAKPWSFLGITMAGYNFVLCGILGVYAVIASIFSTRKANGF